MVLNDKKSLKSSFVIPCFDIFMTQTLSNKKSLFVPGLSLPFPVLIRSNYKAVCSFSCWY